MLSRHAALRQQCWSALAWLLTSCMAAYTKYVLLLSQAPHRPVRELGYAPEHSGVYISRWHHGSPAHRYNLYALHWLTEVNGQAVPDLDAFAAVIKTLPDKSFARLKLCQLETTKTKVSVQHMGHWVHESLQSPCLLHVAVILCGCCRSTR